VLRVNEADELPDDLTGTIGVTAGASAPEALVDEVIARLAPAQGVTEVTVTTEDEYFPPPPELRELLRAVGSMLGFFAGRPVRPVPIPQRIARSPRPTYSTCWPPELRSAMIAA
jgi:4-hydroxy-3-methylbut-2-enyl diphosphate reductase